MNKIELEVMLLRNDMSVAQLSEKIGCNRKTMYRKLASGKFERSEIIKIREVLGLTDADMLRIFFSDDSCENATRKEDASERIETV